MADIARIKGNIEKMIAQGAPETDIDAYISGEGISLGDLTAGTPSEQAVDAAKSGGVGLAEGAIGLAGLPADARSLASSGAKWVFDKLGMETASKAVDAMRQLGGEGATSKAIKSKIEERTGKFYEPQTTAGEYARTVGQFLPSAAIPIGGGPAMRVAGAVAGGLGSEAAGQLTEGTPGEPYARILGGVAGGLAPNMAARAVTPLQSTPERRRLVEVLQNEGVDSLTAGQRTGSNSLRYLESALGDAPFAGGRAQAAERLGREQFTDAALRRAGTGGLATAETLADNQARLGGNFNNIAARNQLVPDHQFVNDFIGTAQTYVSRVLPTQRAQGRQNIEAIMQDIVGEIQQHGGTLPGRLYQDTRSRLSKMAESVRQNDPQLNEALRGIRNALDDAFGRSVSPDDAALLAQTRREYGAQKILEKTASRAGEATGEGLIVPANLRNTVAAENRGAYARGQGDFAELSRAGATVMAPMPQSGTAPRSAIYNIANYLSGGALPAAAGRALMSRPVQAYLGNQLLPGQQPSREALIRALLQSGASQPRLQYQP